MMKYLILILLTTINMLVNSCKQKKHKIENHITETTCKLIPIDFNDTDFMELSLYTIDTITQDGWSIKYFIKDDTTKYYDLYIIWSKGNIRGVYKADYVLQLKRYFIPEYIGENNNNLFFTHACATDCSAVLVFNKDSSIAKNYFSVIDYNIPNGQIVYVTDEGSKDGLSFQIAVVDLLRNKEHIMQFKNLCMSAAYKESCVDTVLFHKEKVIVRANLTVDDYNRDKEITEEKTIILQ